MKKLFAIFASAILSCAVAHAEPAITAFGIELGKPIGLPECKADGRFAKLIAEKQYDANQAATCLEATHRQMNDYYTTERKVTFGGDDAPTIVKWGRAYITEFDGAVQSIRFLTAGIEAQSLTLEALTSKYGKPLAIDSTPVKTAMGASFDSVSAMWETPLIRVSFLGTTGRIDTGSVFIELTEAAARRDAAAKSERGKRKQL